MRVDCEDNERPIEAGEPKSESEDSTITMLATASELVEKVAERGGFDNLGRWGSRVE